MSQKRKVAVIAPCPFVIDRGTPIRIRRLATAMAADFEVHVAAFHQGNDGDYPFKIHRTFPLPFKIKRAGANFAKVCYDFLLIFTSLKLILSRKIKIVDGHLHEGAFIGILLRPFTGAKVIYNAHGTFVQELVATGKISEGSWACSILSRFESWVEKRVDFIVAQSVLRRDEFIAKGLPPEKIAVVEDVPELQQFKVSDAEVDRELEKFLRPDGEKLLIYSGGMEEYQGVDFLMSAFREIALKRRDVRLVLFGRPLEKYRQVAEEMGISPQIVFIDYEPFERLPQYLKICDLGLALRLYGENVPGKLPIYMASGIPVVGTDTKGINTVIQDGETGFLVSPGDVPQLVSKLEFLLERLDLAKKAGERGRQEALRRYSPEDAIRELTRVYCELSCLAN